MCVDIEELLSQQRHPRVRLDGADREMDCVQEEVSDSGHHNGEWLWRPELSHMTSAPGDDPFWLWMRVNWKCMWRSPARQAELRKQSFIVRVWEALWWRFWEHREPLWKLWQEVSLALIMTDTDLSCRPPFFRPHSFMTVAHKHTFPKHTAHCTLKSCEMSIETIARLCFIRHVLQPCNVPESSRVVGCGFVVEKELNCFYWLIVILFFPFPLSKPPPKIRSISFLCHGGWLPFIVMPLSCLDSQSFPPDSSVAFQVNNRLETIFGIELNYIICKSVIFYTAWLT